MLYILLIFGDVQMPGLNYYWEIKPEVLIWRTFSGVNFRMVKFHFSSMIGQEWKAEVSENFLSYRKFFIRIMLMLHNLL